MDCSEFRKLYDSGSMTSPMSDHLERCPACRRMAEEDRTILDAARDLPLHEAPDCLWERIEARLPEPVRQPSRLAALADVVSGALGRLAQELSAVRLKPAVAALALVFTSVLATHYYTTGRLPFLPRAIVERDTVREFDEIEREYLAAIDRLTERAKQAETAMNPELSTLYNEKLAVLDEYIAQCREALDENGSSPYVRKYLALAYLEKMETLKEMTGAAL